MIGRIALDRADRRVRRCPAWGMAWLLLICLAGCASITLATDDVAAGEAAADESKSPIDTAALTIVEVRAGFAGRFKVGYWAPFEVTLRCGPEAVSGELELTVPDGDAVPSRVRNPRGEAISLEPGEQQSILVYGKVGQLKSEATVAFRSGEDTLASRRFSTTDDGDLSGIMPSSQGLIVALGSPLLPDDAATLSQLGSQVANVSDLRQLPTDWWGYEGVNTVILMTGQNDASEQFAAVPEQLKALDQWVRMGGQLVLCVGRGAEKLLAPAAPLAALAPGTFETSVPLRQSTVLETYAETSEPLSPGAAVALQVPKLREVSGRIEVYAGNHPRDLPLVVRSPRGFGETVFVAFDLETAPFTTWAARPQLLGKLLGKTVARAAQDESKSLGQVTTLGFEDLSGQLRGALDQFAEVQVVPFWLVALLVLAYIACIGPLDYFIVRRLFGRMELTWLTFALMVVVFCAGAYALAYGLKGRELRVNQVDLVDYDAPSGLVRGTSWATLFSPRIEAYGLSMVPRAASQVESSPATNNPFMRSSSGIVFSWFGLPGAGFGGLDAQPGATPLFTEPYDFSRRLDALDRVPIAVWSTKSFVGRWWRQAASPIDAELRGRDRLAGTLTSHLPAPLEDCVLFFERWAYPIRQLRPGQSLDLEIDLDPQRTETYLRRVKVQQDRNIEEAYDRASFEIPKIVEIMSAYSMAGGEKYTLLTNDYQPFVDLSRLVAGGRAVLIGRSAEPAATLDRDKRPLDAAGSHWTYYRFVFAVQESAAP
jgi:hypothetical protein